MRFFTNSCGIALTGLLTAASPTVLGQNFQVAPNLANQAAFNAGAVQGANVGLRQGVQVGAINNPYYGSGVYAPYSPTGAYLSGAADVISSQGQFMVSSQQANIMKEQVKQSKVDTRRRNFDEWLYERALTPTTEDERERNRMEQIRRSRNDPPNTEIWSAKALNDLLLTVQQKAARGAVGPSIPLDDDVLHHINVTSGATAGNIGLLKNDGKLKWPLPLKASSFKEDRDKLDKLAPQALKEAATGEVDADTLNSMIGAQKSLIAELKSQIEVLTPNDYIKAKRYLTEIESTIKALQDPQIANYVTRKWAARGNSVPELVYDMGRQGLKFAPATEGDQAAYVALHRALADYDTGMGGQMAAK